MQAFSDAVGRVTTRKGPPSDTQVWELFTSGAMTVPPVTLSPPNGPAPLEVTGRWFWHPFETPASVELDADGDGSPDIVRQNYLEELRYTYAKPGRYRATVSVRDAHGRVRSHTSVVTVVAFADFDADLQGRWTTLKAALRAGDVQGAVECLHSAARQRYRDSFTRLFAGGGGDVEGVLTSIRFVDQQRGRAVYEMLRASDGTLLSFQVMFLLDVDEVWRLYSF